MAKNKTLKELKNIYNYILMDEDAWQEIYNESCQSIDVDQTFHTLLIAYLQKNADYETIKRYLDKILIYPQDNSKRILEKLAIFFTFLERINYVISLEEAEQLILEDNFQLLFSKLLKNKNALAFEEFEDLVENNSNLEILLTVYLNKNNIELVMDDNVLGSKINYNQNNTKEIFERIVSGDKEAYENTVIANLPLVKRIASKYVGQGLDYDDLVQEGSFGLMKAIERYDYQKGYAFSTYAVWWIRQAITRSLANLGRSIRLPVHVAEKMRKIENIQKKYIQDYYRNPTIEELSIETKLSIEQITNILNSVEPISLDSKSKIDEDSELGTFIEDKKINVENEAIASYERDYIIKLCQEALTEREYKIIDLRFGINGGIPKTLEEVGIIIGVTRERIRQIEVRALEKLKRNINRRNFYNKKAPQKEIVYETFSITTIDKKMTMPILIQLINLLPKHERDLYIKYRNIDLNNQVVRPHKIQDYSANFLAYMNLIENDLKTLFAQYNDYVLKNKKSEKIFIDLKKWMQVRNIRFYFSDYSYKEIITAFKKLPEKWRQVLTNRFGDHLLTYKKFENPTSLSYNKVNIAKNKLKKILESKELTSSAPQFRMPKKTIITEFDHDCLLKAMPYLNSKYQNVIYLRHSKDLNQTLPWPNEEDKANINYNVIYNNAKLSLKKIMEKQPWLEDCSKPFKENQKEQRKQLNDSKEKLLKMKQDNLLASIYEEFKNQYSSLISLEDLENIMNTILDSVNMDQIVSEYDFRRRLETAILNLLAFKYQQNPDSEESINILLKLDEIYGKRLREQFDQTSKNLSDRDISKIIKSALEKYDGKLPFYREMSLVLKRKQK